MTIFLRFFVLSLFWGIQCFSLEKTPLFDAIERRDSLAIINFFDQIETITLEDAQELIADFYNHYVVQFGPEILSNEEYLKNVDHYRELYHSILEGYGISLEKSLIRNENGSFPEILLCGKKKMGKKGFEAEVPGSLILGGVEILGGSLVWILPLPGTKQLGGLMIADGVRRTFNGLEEMDKENKKNQSSF